MVDIKTYLKKDVFLCHTSSDKKKYVLPFAKELEKSGISYWLDEAEVKWGDRISQKISTGLKRSKFVIVFLSETFFGKRWSEAELNSALNKETSTGQTIVLPILLGEKNTILEQYPLLRDKKFLEWKDGIAKLIDELSHLIRTSKTSEVDIYADYTPYGEGPQTAESVGNRSRKLVINLGLLMVALTFAIVLVYWLAPLSFEAVLVLFLTTYLMIAGIYLLLTLMIRILKKITIGLRPNRLNSKR